MKDIEKIKSEDLGCQVQDANPGNFAIEQEVGAMVGATVPAPTEPSDDDARELGAQLLVFLRRALTPIKSALRTALADIYDYLDSRCTDYTPAGYAPYRILPYDPMTTPRSVANLLTAITAFAPRKISNGSAPNDGIKDGTSLARLLCDTSAANSVTEIVDDNDWNLLNKGLSFILSMFPSLNKLTLNCKTCTVDVGSVPNNTLFAKLESVSLVNKSENPYSAWIYINGDLIMPELKSFYANQRGNICQETSIRGRFIAEKLESLVTGYNPDFYRTTTLTMFYAPSLKTLSGGSWGQSRMLGSDAENSADLLTKVVVGYGTCFSHANYLTNRPNLIDVEIRQGASASFTLAGWNPTNVLADADKTATFLQNFLEHICQRLANMTGQTKLTLTLSAAVYTAIMTSTDIKAELVARNWKVTDGTNNYNN